MAKNGVAGMSMRDLASAARCNVATIYHHFESKQALLAAVLEEARYLEVLAGPVPVARAEHSNETLEALFSQMIEAMLGVEDFVRLMMGESLRGEPIVLDVGRQLLGSAGEAISRWLEEASLAGRPDPERRRAASRVALAALVGFFFEYLTSTSGRAELLAGCAHDLASFLDGS